MDLRVSRVMLLALALLAAGLAGCAGEPLEPTGSPDRGAPADGHDTADRSQHNDTGATTAPEDEGNDTREHDDTAGFEDNGTGEEGANETVEPREEPVYDPGWPPMSEAAIRPGAKLGVLELRGWNYCTVGFVLSDPSNRTLYLASAAHCFGEVEIGTEIALGGIEGAGTLAYCSWGTAASGDRSACPATEPLTLNRTRDNDLALVRVDEEHRSEVHPAMLGWKGPSGLDRDASLGDRVLTYGNSPYRDDGGSEVPDLLDPREGYVEGQGEWTTWFNLVGHTTGGDSGSPVRTDEGALGLLIRTGGPDNPVGIYATNLGPAIDFVNEHTDLTIELATWPEQEAGLLPRGPSTDGAPVAR